MIYFDHIYLSTSSFNSSQVHFPYNFFLINPDTPVCFIHILSGCPIHGSMVDLLGAIPLKNTESPSPKSHQLLQVSTVTRMLTGLILWRSHSCCVPPKCSDPVMSIRHCLALSSLITWSQSFPHLFHDGACLSRVSGAIM